MNCIFEQNFAVQCFKVIESDTDRSGTDDFSISDCELSRTVSERKENEKTTILVEKHNLIT